MAQTSALITLTHLSDHERTPATREPSESSVSHYTEATENQSRQDEGQASAPENAELSLVRAVIVIGTLTGITVASSMGSGLLTVGLPRMAKDLDLPNHLLLWPASVYGLTSGCALLLCGSIADVVGSRSVYLTGSFFLAMLTLACGLARTGIQLIMFRALQGIAIACCFPTAVSIMTMAFPNGSRRNVGFACLGAGQPLGWSVGMVLGGLFVDSIGWRYGYYLCAVLTMIIFGAGVWGLPNPPRRQPFVWRRLIDEIDWLGTLLASSCLGILSYVLAVVTASLSNLEDTSNIVLLCVAAAIVPIFIFWVGRQERLGKPALIPNSLWKKPAFTGLCLMVFLSWAVLNTMEYFCSLFFQEVQTLSATQTSLRFLPNVLAGAAANIVTGLLVHKVSALHLVLASSLISAGGPLLMALINPQWSYWYAAFWAVLLCPLSADVLFTVSNLIVTSLFSDDTQALAGAVFNTVAQFGSSVGLAVTAVISSSVTQRSRYPVKTLPAALMEGYRDSFWVMFSSMVLACLFGAWGLRTAGRVGLKRE